MDTKFPIIRRRAGRARAGHGLRRHRRGISLIYLSIILIVLFGFGSLAVDWGRVQVAKTQLQQAADAAARYGAMGIENDPTTARANALAAALENGSDGKPVALDSNLDVLLGTWDPIGRTFTQSSPANESTATAIKISAHRTAARGNPIPTIMAQVIGRTSIDVNATAIAVYTRGQQEQITVGSNSNPWLAGMPAGTVANPGNPHNNPDYAGTALNPKQSPILTDIPLVAGRQLTFDAVNGGANNFSSDTLYTPDGNLAWLTDNFIGVENGHTDVTAPINAVMGVFLTDANPATDGVPLPGNLDFSTPTERNFQNLAPKLKQVFFIGDGRRDDGSQQTFTVPSGATRLFIGTMDGYEWNNNVGTYKVTVHRLGSVSLVK